MNCIYIYTQIVFKHWLNLSRIGHPCAIIAINIHAHIVWSQHVTTTSQQPNDLDGSSDTDAYPICKWLPRDVPNLQSFLEPFRFGMTIGSLRNMQWLLWLLDSQMAENPKITRQMPPSYSNTTVSLHGHEAKVRPVVDKVPHEWMPNHETIKSIRKPAQGSLLFAMWLPWLLGIWIGQTWAKDIRNKANCSLSQTSRKQKCWLQPHTLQAGPVGENGVRFWEVLVNETDNA